MMKILKILNIFKLLWKIEKECSVPQSPQLHRNALQLFKQRILVSRLSAAPHKLGILWLNFQKVKVKPRKGESEIEKSESEHQ